MQMSLYREGSVYRFYCDNDPQSSYGGARWTLRSDPAPDRRPQDYVENRRRPRWPPRYPGQQVQEYEDSENGLYMLDSIGCQGAGVQAKSYFEGWLIGGQSSPKASVTVS